jgi:porphobilinogen synthase
MNGYPTRRLRRLRRTPVLRRMVRETRLSPANLIAATFVVDGENVREEIASMPGVFRLSPELVVEQARILAERGVSGLILFGIPEKKSADGASAYDPKGPVPEALRRIKAAGIDLVLMADVCLCEYTDHGHCGILDGKTGLVKNDPSVEALAKAALCYARAGADVVAPSDMMDGRVQAIRRALDHEGFEETAILAYAAKYASGFYGPFRDAAGSTPAFGDRKSYQMDPSNRREALAEVALDIEEGADLVMVKPALAYLDVIREVRDRFGVPVAAYNVSGEFAMVKAAAAQGWIDEKRVTLEILTAIRRAGADLILTYHAADAAMWLLEGDDA